MMGTKDLLLTIISYLETVAHHSYLFHMSLGWSKAYMPLLIYSCCHHLYLYLCMYVEQDSSP